jgi:hypothetical protein
LRASFAPGFLFFVVLADEWPDEIENGAEDVLRGFEKRSLPDSFAVGAELFVEAVDVYDQPKTPERAVAELIGRNPEVAVIDVDEFAKDIDEKPVAAGRSPPI